MSPGSLLLTRTAPVSRHAPVYMNCSLPTNPILRMPLRCADASTRATTWVVGGVSYAVTPATDLNDVQGALAVGSTAVVNSYPAGDGSRIATQIRGVTLGERVFLPAVVR